ncbi:hypothetical protein GFV12_01045 [Desulfurobacterium thermolithotrophum]|uniref:hypothetical protein n=1 Tax=Desulfurobacterium thermolithotrophum TaxID=64160 RepID=UPI0013D383E4|nr:hypothetical protein [Desulfurobacterium thermolithotrophum]
MRKSLLLLTATFLSSQILIGCGRSSDTVETIGTTGTTKTVTVIDGRVDGAFVFADCNKNKKYDQGEPSASSTNGTATLNIPSTCDYNEIIAIMNNATDIDLNVKVNGVLLAPANSTVVSPITTLVTVKPEIRNALKQKLKLEKEPEELDYVEDWNNLNEEAKRFIAGLIGAINVVSKEIKIGDEEIEIKAIEDLAEKIATKVETINATNSTEVASAIIDTISSNEFVVPTNSTLLSEKIEKLVENAADSNDFKELEDEVNETISITDETLQNIDITNATDENILSYLMEGRFDLVRTMLSEKTDLTDAQKVAYALAILGTSIDTNILNKVGAYIIPGSNEAFDIYGLREPEERNEITKKVQNISPSEWEKSVTSLVKDIEEAIRKLDEVSGNVNFSIPSNFVEDKVVHVDKGSLDVLKGLLLAKKALLEYLLTYDWSVYDNMTDENAALPYLAKIKPVNTSYLSASKEDFKKALDYLKTATNYDYKQTLAYYLTEKDNQTDINNLADITLTQIIYSLDGEAVVENPEQTGSVTLDLSYIFGNSIDGSQIQADIDSGKIKEFKVCQGFYSYWNGTGVEYKCFDYENEIWFKQDSYLYNYLRSISPDIKFDNRTLDGETWYTIDGSEYWNITPPQQVYPR